MAGKYLQGCCESLEPRGRMALVYRLHVGDAERDLGARRVPVIETYGRDLEEVSISVN